MNDGIEKGLMVLLLLVIAAVLGSVLMHAHMAAEMDQQAAQFEKILQQSKDAKAAAEQRATNIENAQKGVIDNAVATYKANNAIDKARDAAVIADLRNDVTRLRVRTNRPAACGGQVPDAAASTSGPADAGDETLAGPVAARLAGRYADYNRIVEKLTACQAIVKADRMLD